MSKAKDDVAALRHDYDNLVNNVLKERDARIQILEQGRDSMNKFFRESVIPSMNRTTETVLYLDAFIAACVAPTGIRAMGTIHKQVIAKAKREQARRARAAKAASTVTDISAARRAKGKKK